MFGGRSSSHFSNDKFEKENTFPLQMEEIKLAHFFLAFSSNYFFRGNTSTQQIAQIIGTKTFPWILNFPTIF